VDEHTRRMPLGEILVAAGAIDEDQLAEALAAQHADDTRQRLGRVIVDLGLASEVDIALALADQLGLATVDLSEVEPEPEALARVPRRLAERHHLLPLRLIGDGGALEIAMSDPTNVVAVDDVRLTARTRSVRLRVATESAIADALRRAYGLDQDAIDVVDALGEGEVLPAEHTGPESDVEAPVGDDQPIIRLANAILTDAVRNRASDIHVEPERHHVRIRYRIDGLLRETMQVPSHIGPALGSRLKIMSNLDITERRRPQDGRSVIRVDGTEVDLRVATMPTMFGETIVLRLLRKGSQQLDIGDLGLPPDDRELFEIALRRPQGLIVFTGPTGSGKTTSLYAGMSELADPVRNVLTLEDPVEYQLPGVNQTQVNPKIGLTFARGLRNVLRQDPDVVMVGEIRDRETAELAMEASFTGHLVLSTLHTNDAVSTVVRLVDLGIERFLIASSLLLVAAQRLARVVCPHCEEPTEPSARTLKLLGLDADDLAGKSLVAGAGCTHCDHTGYLGRTGLYEMLEITPALRELITAGGTETQLATLARRQGMRSLREDGIAKALAGITTLDEVVRTTPEPTVSDPVRLEEYDPAAVAPPATGAAATTATARAGDASAREDAEREARGFTLRFDPDTGEVEGGRVLVVEDDDSIRDLLATILGDRWEVSEAADGATAFERYERERPDLILLDHHLPDVTGIEVTRRIRDADGRRHVPIVMITGDSDHALEVEGLLAGVDDYVAKPFDADVLEARIGALLRRKHGR
jgi:type IV pilus assembly protein PilB